MKASKGGRDVVENVECNCIVSLTVELLCNEEKEIINYRRREKCLLPPW